jgi:hypothetical protein
MKYGPLFFGSVAAFNDSSIFWMIRRNNYYFKESRVVDMSVEALKKLRNAILNWVKSPFATFEF